MELIFIYSPVLHKYRKQIDWVNYLDSRLGRLLAWTTRLAVLEKIVCFYTFLQSSQQSGYPTEIRITLEF